jgi:hypothetical protein
MKTSQNEGVSDRPPTPITCPDARRRSSARDGCCQFVANGRRSSRFGYSRWSHSAPPPRCRALRFCDRGRVRQRGDQRFPKPSTIFAALVATGPFSATEPRRVRRMPTREVRTSRAVAKRRWTCLGNVAVAIAVTVEAYARRERSHWPDRMPVSRAAVAHVSRCGLRRFAAIFG